MRRTTIFLALLALSSASRADAQTGSGEENGAAEPDVVVTGERLEGKALHREAAEFVRRIGVATGHRPAARWAEPVCPAAYGVADALAARVVAKLRRVAAEAGIRTAPGKCKPNLAVLFASDGAASARRMAKHLPSAFDEVEPAAKERLFKGSAPIRWWYLTEALGTDGRRSSPDSPLGGISTTGRTKFMSRFHGSIVSTEIVRAIHSAVIVIDVNRSSGRTLDTVSAFAALVGFAEISPQEPPPQRSILSVFADERAARSDLTEWDMTFLKALYRLPLDREARMHRGLLTQALVNGRGG